MFYNTPFFGFPNAYLHPYYKASNLHSSKNNLSNSNSINNNYNLGQKNSSASLNFKEAEEVHNSSYEDNYFNFLGLNLQSDDLLILGLLFFLYKEGCDDIYLYIALFLLLLS